MQKISFIFQKFPRWTALIAGTVSAAGFAPWGLWPLTLICFALLIHLIAQAATGKRAFLLGWLFGVGHFSIGNQWIAVAFTFQAAMPIWLGYVAVFTLALYLAVYPAIATLGAWWFANSPLPFRRGGKGLKLPLILAFAGFWIIAEWLRSWVFTGYVWNPLSAVLPLSFVEPPLIRWIGTYGSSGAIILIVGLVMVAAAKLRTGRTNWRTALAPRLVLLALAFAFGLYGFLGRTALLKGEPNSITVVQPNRPQNEKDAPGFEAINFAKLAINSYPLPGQGPRLILWSEDALPDYLEDGYPFRFYQFQPGGSALGARARLTTLMGEGDILLMGSNRLVIDKNGQMAAARNSMTAMDAKGRILGNYDKAHLVPYGEYLPLKWLLTPLGLSRLVPGNVDFLPGPGPQTMTLSLDGKPIKVGLQICYEIIFSGQVIDRKNRPDFIFNPSNDSWFGTVGPPQFLAQARLRAIEEGLPVVRATPTGISAIIDADGQIVESLPHRTSGRIDGRLPVAKAPTLFARFGNILPLCFAALLIAAALLPLARARTSR